MVALISKTTRDCRSPTWIAGQINILFDGWDDCCDHTERSHPIQLLITIMRREWAFTVQWVVLIRHPARSRLPHWPRPVTHDRAISSSGELERILLWAWCCKSTPWPGAVLDKGYCWMRDGDDDWWWSYRFESRAEQLHTNLISAVDLYHLACASPFPGG